MIIKKSDLFPDFVQRLQYAYNEKWKGTLQEFADAVMEATPEYFRSGTIDRSSVSAWLSGSKPCLKYIPAICKVLNIDISEFVITHYLDKYQYSSELANDIDKQRAEIAEKNFKIDLTFLQGLRNIIPDFDSHFPFYGSLQKDDSCPVTASYTRMHGIMAHIKAAQTTQGKGLFQLYQSGHNRNMNEYDLKLIRLLQIHMQRCYYAWCNAIAEKLDADQAAANMEYVKKNPVIKFDIETDQLIISAEDYGKLIDLTEEELQSLDPLGIYSETERKKYHLD